MQRSIERHSFLLKREASQFSTCMFTTSFDFRVGQVQAVATGYVDQMFGTDSILDSQPRRMGGLQSMARLHYVQFGPITGFSEGIDMKIDQGGVRELENFLATGRVLKNLDGWIGYQLNKLKGLRPRDEPTSTIKLDTIIREPEDGRLQYVCGTLRLAGDRTLRIEFNYLTNSLSIFHHYLTGCLPVLESHKRIATEESKEPEERLWRFLADLWTASNGVLNCQVDIPK